MSIERCPRCGQAIGDGDRVHYGLCSRCLLRGRWRR